jgi:hypothetical protein
VFDHIHSLVSHEDWNVINKAFWNLAKETDQRSQHTFDAEYEEFVTMVEKAAMLRCNADKRVKLVENALTWLRICLYEKRHMWAYRFTWRHFTAGCHSTQRAESIHSAIKVSYSNIHFMNCAFLYLLTLT